MADIAALLDSAGLAGLQSGKKGHKGLTQEAGQTGFIAALMSQIAAEGASKGKVADVGALLAKAAANGAADSVANSCSNLVANSMGNAAAHGNIDDAPASPSGAAPSIAARHVVSQLAAVPSIVSERQADKASADKPLAALVPVMAAELDGDAKQLPAGLGNEAEAEMEQAVQQAAPNAADVALLQSVPGNPLAAAIQAASANPAQEAPVSDDEGKTDALTLPQSKGGDAKSRAFDPGKTGLGQVAVSANAAGDEVSGRQVLPALASDVSQETTAGEANPLPVSSGNTATTLLQSGSAITPPAPETSSVRPFDQALRQVEARVNVAVDAPVRSPAFATEFGEKMVWFAGRQGQVAEMTLNPPQMGSVEIRLTVAGGEAGAHFFSANPAVREAIEAALPKLRDLMAQAGINLGEANVRDQSFAQGKGSERSDAALSAMFPGSEAAADSAGFGAPRSLGLGLVDLYA